MLPPCKHSEQKIFLVITALELHSYQGKTGMNRKEKKSKTGNQHNRIASSYKLIERKHCGMSSFFSILHHWRSWSLQAQSTY